MLRIFLCHNIACVDMYSLYSWKDCAFFLLMEVCFPNHNVSRLVVLFNLYFELDTGKSQFERRNLNWGIAWIRLVFWNVYKGFSWLLNGVEESSPPWMLLFFGQVVLGHLRKSTKHKLSSRASPWFLLQFLLECLTWLPSMMESMSAGRATN